MEKKNVQVVELLKIAVLALLIVIPIRQFLFQPFVVRGESMEPSFYNDDYLIVDQMSYRFRNPERGEVVVFRYPEDPSKRHIKRVIGLPGESILVEEGRVYVESEEEKFILEENYLYLPKSKQETSFSLEEQEYFVMGDNRGASRDSRNWGALPKENIIGRVVFQISFFDSFSRVPLPEY